MANTLEHLATLGFQITEDEQGFHFYPYAPDGTQIGETLKELGFDYSEEEKTEDGAVRETYTYRKGSEIFVHESFYTTSGDEGDLSTDIVRYYRS